MYLNRSGKVGCVYIEINFSFVGIKNTRGPGEKSIRQGTEGGLQMIANKKSTPLA